MKKALKYILAIFVILNFLIILSGNSWFYKAVSVTFLKGYTSSYIDDYIHFPSNSIKNGNVFGSDMTELMLLGKNQKVVFNHTSKESVAFAILNEIEQYLQGAKNW